MLSERRRPGLEDVEVTVTSPSGETRMLKLEAGAGVKLGIAKDESGVSQVQLSPAGGSKVSMPESLMDANQEVKVESKSAAAATAASTPTAWEGSTPAASTT